MFNIPRLPEVDLSKIDLSKLDPSKFELPFELPQFEFPDFKLPTIDLPSSDQVAGFARDAAYVGVGVAVTTAERIQALQQRLLEVLKTQLTTVADSVRAAV